jgi:transcriptional regulator with XRE-family HTH domain
MAYPTFLSTLGDHLRKVRLDRGLSQPHVAKIFNVSTDTVTGWELNRNKPQARLAKKIIQFLGYVPSIGSQASLGKRLRQARQILGHSQEMAGKRMGCDESNIRQIELGQRNPMSHTEQKIEKYILIAKEKMKKIGAV